MVSNRVFLDDLLVYQATANELGEDGEFVDVYTYLVPSHIEGQIGSIVALRLEYSDRHVVEDSYIFESITEDLINGGVILRFLLDEQNYMD